MDMTVLEHQQVRDLIDKLNRSDWLNGVADPDIPTGQRSDAWHELAKVAKTFRHFTAAQRAGFLLDYHPQAICLGAIVELVQALTRADD